MVADAAPSRVLVVGAGLTGALVSRSLRRLLPASSRVVVWEAADSVGGRMRCERHGASLTDVGAQYITPTGDNSDLCDELRRAGLLVPLSGRIDGTRAADGGGQNFVSPDGLQAIVAHLLDSTTVECGRAAAPLRLASDAKWSAGGGETFDGVVLTPPVPQLLPLLGEAAASLDAPTRAALDGVEFSARYALSCFYGTESAPIFARELDWVSRYVPKDEDDALVFLSHDSAKRSAATPPSLLAHTSVPFGLKHLRAGTPDDDVQADLLARLSKLLPWLPPPERVALHAWKNSQVRAPLELPGGAAALLGGGTTPPVVLAGDAFAPLGSRFDGCAQSADAAAAALVAALRERE